MCEKSWVLEARQQRVRCKAKVGKARSRGTCMLSQGVGALSWRLWGARPSFQESEMTRFVFELATWRTAGAQVGGRGPVRRLWQVPR